MLMHSKPGTPCPPDHREDGTRAPPLSRREIELLQTVRLGLSDKEIGTQLCISTGTVKTHLRNIFRKLGARNRVHALALHGSSVAER